MTEKEFDKKLEELAKNEDLWMNCTYKIMDEEGNKLPCLNQVLKSDIDKNNQNNNYCCEHKEIVDEINKKRMQETKNEYIKSVRACLLQMSKESFNKDDILDLLNHVNHSEVKFVDNKKLKENINNHINNRISQLKKEREEALRKNNEFYNNSFNPLKGKKEFNLNEAQKQSQVYLSKDEASKELEWLKNKMNAGDFDGIE